MCVCVERCRDRQGSGGQAHREGTVPGWWGQLAAAALRAVGKLDILAAQAQLVAPQVVVERLHVGENALGVGLLAHDHHVLHLHEGYNLHFTDDYYY